MSLVTAKGQQYGNEWIDYDQKYFHFPVFNTGVHRIYFNTIDSIFNLNGIDLSQINHSQFQIFGREKEVSILINDINNNNILDQNEYVEFYAEKNDGWLDELVYDSAQNITDKYFSLFNDTINYYFTWNNGFNNLRTIIETDIEFDQYSTINYCWKKILEKYSSTYVMGEKSSGISSPKYTAGEGWSGPQRNIGGPYLTNLNSNNFFSGGPNAYGRINLASTNSSTVNVDGNNHNTKFYINSNLIYDSSYFGYKVLNIDFNIQNSNLSNTTTIEHYIGNISQSYDNQHVSSIELCYPHNTNFSEYDALHFGLSLNQKKRFTINNMINNSSNPTLYMLDNINRIIPISENANSWEAVIPPSSSDTNLFYLFDQNSIHEVTNFKSVSQNGYFTEYNSLQIDSAFIIITNKKLLPSANEYANYRSNLYNTLVVNIDEIYHQFSGGIFKNPLAIRRFVKSLMDNWNTWPSHIFLIGKSVRFNDEGTPGSRFNDDSYAKNLVPSWGYPSSDNHILVGLSEGKRGYPIPVGRLSVTSNYAVLNYLNKVIGLENQQGLNNAYTIENKSWQKNIAHFGGGSSASEQNYILSNFEIFENIIGDSYYGGLVKTFDYNPDELVANPFEFQEIQEILENGISLMTIFGHASSGGGFSLNIDDPEYWNNPDKYPMVIGLGCNAGDVHNPDTSSYSEELLRPEQSGAIGFISTIREGFTPYINTYTKILYETISKGAYHGTIGQQMVITVDSLDSSTPFTYWGPKFEGNYNGMSLQGDPAIKLNTHPFAEYVLQENKVWTTPQSVNLSVSEFDLNIEVNNLGKAVDDSLFMKVRQIYPDGSDTNYTKLVSSVKNKDTIIFKILNNPEKCIGLNNFQITADLPISFIQEAEDEINNNQINFSLNISSNSIIPIWPYDLSIIGNHYDTLRVSTINPLEKINTYYFEIDTTDNFNSPFLKKQTVISTGGVIEAIPFNWINNNTGLIDSLILNDSTVYYWRTRPDSNVIDWKNRSFQYVPDKWGWGQAHIDQFKYNDYFNIALNEDSRTFEFSQTYKTISCNTYIQHAALSPEWNGTFFQVSGETADYGGYTSPAIMIGVIDPNTLEFWETPFIDNSVNPSVVLNPDHCFGQFNGDPGVCGNTSLMGRSREHGYFVFNYYNPIQLDSLASMLNNKIPEGHYILAYSYIPNNYGGWQLYTDSLYTNWPNSLFTAFENLGATGFTDQNQNDDGFIFFCQKGDPSTANTIRSDEIFPGLNAESELLEFYTTVYSNLESGKITSPIIGPTNNWKNIYWSQNSKENPTDDSTRIKIYGLPSPEINQQELLIDSVFNAYDSILDLQPILYKYNYIKLEMETYDDSLQTPAQIKKWQLTYDPLPDLAINPKKSWLFDFDTTTLQQGETGYLSIAFENVTPFDMDSVVIEYEIENRNSSYLLPYQKQDSLKAREVLIDTIAVDTKFFQDHCNFYVNANPTKITGNLHQPEQFTFNNFLFKPFFIGRDITNPLLDVTFDGIHIMNNEIISPTPTILITLKDENPFLLLNEDTDTSNIQIEIKYPNSNQWEKVHYVGAQGIPIIDWEFENEKNKFIATYRPTFEEDGKYGLRVQGMDKSGNLSGSGPYEIYFEVLLRSSITNVFNYPNPFSTKTHFVFTLTGQKIPDELTIQILNINGRLVKQIHLHETEMIRIGNNITDYYWDGKDEFGDPLANGVYLYRVTAKINNEEIEHRNSAADNAFKKGFGKIYLLR